MILAHICLGWCAFILVINFLSMWLMGRKCRARARNMPVPANAPPVSIVRPLCGLETFSEETLGATFHLDYPNYEIIFCVQSPNDPIIALVERLIAAHPGRDARLLGADDYVSSNPKLNNCVKGWAAARTHLASYFWRLSPADFPWQLILSRVLLSLSGPAAREFSASICEPLLLRLSTSLVNGPATTR